MAPRRLSRLQRHILKCLMAEYRRTQGGTLLGHYELVQALGRDKSNVSHSLRTLEARGVTFDGPPERQAWGGVLAHFQDPDGNILTLVEYPS